MPRDVKRTLSGLQKRSGRGWGRSGWGQAANAWCPQSLDTQQAPEAPAEVAGECAARTAEPRAGPA